MSDEWKMRAERLADALRELRGATIAAAAEMVRVALVVENEHDLRFSAARLRDASYAAKKAVDKSAAVLATDEPSVEKYVVRPRDAERRIEAARIGYIAGHNDTVESRYGDPDEVAADICGDLDDEADTPVMSHAELVAFEQDIAARIAYEISRACHRREQASPDGRAHFQQVPSDLVDALAVVLADLLGPKRERGCYKCDLCKQKFEADVPFDDETNQDVACPICQHVETHYAGEPRRRKAERAKGVIER